MALGNNLKRFRERLGISQGKLAEMVDLSLHTIFRMENNKSQPRASDLEKIAVALGCTVSELLNGQQKNEWKINIAWEVDDMNALDIKTDEFTVGFRGNGDFILWGSVPADKSLDEATGRIRDELAAAMAGRDAYEAKKKLNG